MGETKSCSACCGLFNLKGDDAARHAWIRQNTDQFIALDISEAVNIVAFRKEREAVTLPNRVREDIYVCPFIGFVSGDKTHGDAEQTIAAPPPGASLRTGCLLHPQGSPHPQIALWPHPQNFSFYGEGICLSYDCLAKDRRVYRGDFFLWAETASVFDYGRLASDHTLHRTLAILPEADKDLSRFYETLARFYGGFAVVTTSFEDIEKTLPETWAELCLFLGRRIHPGSAQKIAGQLLAAAAG